ncbi:MAG: nitronate monooxygenase, partial [Chloroflexi bacterium]
DNLKQALIALTELDTLPILGSLRNTLRAWKNPAALKVAELEARQADMWEILPIVAGTESRRMYEEGDVEAGIIACSQSIGIVGQIKPVADVIEEMVREAVEIHGRLID